MKKYKLITLILLLSGCCIFQREEPIMSVEIRSQLGDVLLSGNPIWVEVYGTAPTGATDYTTLLRIVSTDSALEGAPFIDAIIPDSDHLANYNIQARVDQEIDYTFEHPQVNRINSYDMLAFDITLEAGEEYLDSDGDKQTVWSGLTESHRILQGGLSHFQQNEFLPYQFFDEFISDGKFLTWQENYSIITINHPLKLWYIYPGTDSPELEIKVAGGYAEGGNVVNVRQTFNSSPNNLYEINLSPSVWSIDTTHATYGNLVSLSVEISKAGVRITDQRIYYYNRLYYEENTFVYFKNSIGGVDCLWCSGRNEEILNTNTQIASKPDIIANVAYPNRPTQVVSSLTAQRKWNINTGYKSKDELVALRDFALSDKIWIVSDENYIIPVILENRAMILKNLQRDLDSLDITLIEAHIEKYY